MCFCTFEIALFSNFRALCNLITDLHTCWGGIRPSSDSKMYCKILLPLSLGAFHRKLRLVLLRDTNLGGAGLSGSQDFVKNDTVSLAPPRIWLGPISVNAWIRMWYSVHGLKSVSLHSIYRVKKINICLLILACFILSERVNCAYFL